MAERFDDTEFWLPQQFLSEDDCVVFNNYGSAYNRGRGFISREGSFGSVNFGFGDSDLSSPVDFVVSSTDSGKSDEEYFGSLTGPLNPASSPETWNLLYEAAGEVAKMRLSDSPARKSSLVSVPMKNSTPDFDYQFNNSVQQQQLQALRFQQMELAIKIKMKQQKQALWEEQVKASLIQRQQLLIAQQMNKNMNLTPVTCLSLKHQQNSKSGIRAVFRDHPQALKERAGTGVFLPRRGNYPPESRKKSSTSPYLNRPPRQLPQVQPRYGCGLFPETDGAMRIRDINNMLLQAQKNRQQHIQPHPTVNHEIRLPQEWTY